MCIRDRERKRLPRDSIDSRTSTDAHTPGWSLPGTTTGSLRGVKRAMADRREGFVPVKRTVTKRANALQRTLRAAGGEDGER
eukprot:4926946-Prorocentrum_lima.AAC.1